MFGKKREQRRVEKVETDSAEREKMARLEQAETDLLHLKARRDQAILTLDARHRRNHWKQSVEQMIQGGF